MTLKEISDTAKEYVKQDTELEVKKMVKGPIQMLKKYVKAGHNNKESGGSSGIPKSQIICDIAKLVNAELYLGLGSTVIGMNRGKQLGWQ